MKVDVGARIGSSVVFPQRSLLCSSHTTTSTSCKISLSHQSHNHTSLYHNTMSLSPLAHLNQEPNDSCISSLSVCNTWKAGLSKCSAVVSPPLARRLLLHPPPAPAAAKQQSGPTRQRRGRRQGQSGETAGADLKTILTPW